MEIKKELKLINIDSPTEDILYFLNKAQIYPEGQLTSISKPGEGNMNIVVRASFGNKSFILKQSRPYVAKYEFLEAPKERILVEAAFYQKVSPSNNNPFFPGILHLDKENFLLIMEDLGDVADFTSIYNEREISAVEIQKLTAILNEIHRIKEVSHFPLNMDLRILNHQHIFVLPFEKDNGFRLDDIQEGLDDLANKYKRDSKLKKIVNELGQKYLSKGNVLLHGDYYPGSWISTEHQTYVIDPEFSFVGFPEFDLGVMAGHLWMANQAMEDIQSIIEQYEHKFDEGLFYKIAGTEIMRRLIGIAQLPLTRTLEEKEELLEMAYKFIIS